MSNDARSLSPEQAQFKTVKHAPSYRASAPSGGTAFPLRGQTGTVGALWVSSDGEGAGFVPSGTSLEVRRTGLAVQRALVRSFQRGSSADDAVREIMGSIPDNIGEAQQFVSLDDLRAQFTLRANRVIDLR